MLIADKILTYEEFRRMEFDDNDQFIYELSKRHSCKKKLPYYSTPTHLFAK